MGAMHKLELEERLGKIKGLEIHLASNFYPPLRAEHQLDITRAFKEYWDDVIDTTELADRCWLKDADGLYRYFDCFLKEEE